MLLILLRALLIGFFASAPMGPVGMLCIQRTLNESRKHGLVTGLGAVTGDMIFALIAVLAALGLGVDTQFISKHELPLKIISGVILIVFGAFFYKKNPSKNLTKLKEGIPKFWKVYFSSTVLTISNIGTLFFYIGLLARFNMVDASRHFYFNLFVVISIGIGCFLWWLLVCYGVSKLKHKFNPRGLRVFNKIVGIILIVVGVIALVSVIKGLNINI